MSDRIIIMNSQWSRRRHEIWRRALARMQHVYPIFNRMYFAGMLETAVLDLDDGPARLWAKGRSLFVPLEMAEKQPWRLVEENMLQQMIHKYIHQVLKCETEAEHQRNFQRFCERPKVRLALSMSFGLPGFALPEGRTPEEDRLLQRIQRLLALSESPNPHEAESALREAQRLMLVHNIDLSIRADPHGQRYGLRHLGRPVKTMTEAHTWLAQIMTHFFVKRIWVPGFNVHEGRGGTLGKILEICGTPGNLDMACHVYGFLTETAERLWRERRRRLGQGGDTGRADYVTGVYSGFASKLKEQAQRNQVEGLIWVGDKGLDDFFDQLHPSLVDSKPPPQRKWGELKKEGFAAGRKIDLHRPLDKHGPLGP